MILSALFMPILFFKHGIDIYAVSPGRIVQENMRHSPDEFSILQNGTSAHSLYDTARFGNQFLIRNFDYKILIALVILSTFTISMVYFFGHTPLTVE